MNNCGYAGLIYICKQNLREKTNFAYAFKLQPLRYFYHFLVVIFCLFIRRGRNIPQSRKIVHFINELKYRFVLSLIRYFVRCHANHVNIARILIGSKSTNHVCQSFTREVRVNQHEKVGEKVGENRHKFYFVANTFPTWLTVAVSFTYANLSLPTLVCPVKAPLQNKQRQL